MKRPWTESLLIELQALEYGQEQFSAIGGAMATVINLIEYYVQFEPLYVNEDLEVVQHLKAAVVEVYSTILRVLYLAKSYYDKNGSRNPRPLPSLAHDSVYLANIGLQ